MSKHNLLDLHEACLGSAGIFCICNRGVAVVGKRLQGICVHINCSDFLSGYIHSKRSTASESIFEVYSFS